MEDTKGGKCENTLFIVYPNLAMVIRQMSGGENAIKSHCELGIFFSPEDC